MTGRRQKGVFVALVAGSLLAACSSGSSQHHRHGAAPDLRSSGITKIRHVVVVMMENRSFDSYFGTYPGADGLPRRAGKFTVCVPDPVTKICQRPYHDRHDVNAGGPHGRSEAFTDINRGRMDGFLRVLHRKRTCANVVTPSCAAAIAPDVMGYHDGKDLPNYWTWARKFVLQDHMFQPDLSWSLPAHLFAVSEWSARCRNAQPMSCVNAPQRPDFPPLPGPGLQRYNPKNTIPTYAWTDLTYLLHRAGISWRYYVTKGSEPDCRDDGEIICVPFKQSARTPGVWNPLPYFQTVRDDHQLSNIRSVHHFLRSARTGTLPQVSWVVPSFSVSDHPQARISDGQAFLTGLVNEVMRGPDWSSTAMFITWDDWGGFYDHVVPPRVDVNGYGLRVPGLLISPYAKQGYIDHQVLSFDAYVKFIEDRFLQGDRLDPATDGRPDRRTSVRENEPRLGDLLQDFDFNQAPLPPVVLPLRPKTDLLNP